MISSLLVLIVALAVSCSMTTLICAGVNRRNRADRREIHRIKMQKANAKLDEARQQVRETRAHLKELEEKPDRELAERADQQVKWLNEGDPRGIYGDYLPYVYSEWPQLGIINTEQTLADCLKAEYDAKHPNRVVVTEKPAEAPIGHQVEDLQAEIDIHDLMGSDPWVPSQHDLDQLTALAQTPGQHCKVIVRGSSRIFGCSCGARCPLHLSVTSLPRNDDDWFRDHLSRPALSAGRKYSSDEQEVLIDAEVKAHERNRWADFGGIANTLTS